MHGVVLGQSAEQHMLSQERVLLLKVAESQEAHFLVCMQVILLAGVTSSMWVKCVCWLQWQSKPHQWYWPSAVLRIHYRRHRQHSSRSYNCMRVAQTCLLVLSTGSSLCLLQQRAPAIPGRQKAFAAELAAWAKEAGFSQVLLLSGLDAQYRREQQLEGSQLRYLSSSSSSGGGGAGSSAASPEQGQPPEQQQQQLAASCKAVGLQQLEADVIENEQELHGLLPPWPILEELQRTEVPHTLLSAFAAEGDNTADAMRLAGSVLSVLALQGLVPSSQQKQSEQALRVPCSWASLFGRRGIDSTLF